MTEVAAYRIAIAGVVQGVGFRPFVYNLAQRLGVRGWVRNHSGGVAIEAEAAPEILEAFTRALRDEAPPLAYIASLTWESIPLNGYAAFEIRQSERQPGQYQLISPDVATCPDCLRELLDPQDRRCRYPFINCTNCGPRFTIINDIPYDRPNTTMGVFPLCDDCAAEYRNPGDRRFHAQPNACPVCGPHIWWVESAPLQTASEDELRALATRAPTVHPGQEETEAVLAQARDWLLEGKILAIKGLGGFHLACDATNPQAVEELRRRKRRPYKPFAVMVPTLADARRQCVVAPEAERAFSSPQCPIVLLDRRPDSTIAENVAPRNHTLGLMMPYTPLHHILLRDVGRPLVMTSGNVTEEPIARDNDEALRRLAGLADAFVLHNRDIYARYDDAVVQVIPPATPPAGAPDDGPGVLIQPVRRARGYAPFPIRLPFAVDNVLATGPLLKNTFCLA
ncbi:MAG: carbamoyltransferase HypF, partial [Anaerolineae bacterium]|nr:carbamoyltransferase HypF [Anaerolineae bacterium]